MSGEDLVPGALQRTPEQLDPLFGQFFWAAFRPEVLELLSEVTVQLWIYPFLGAMPEVCVDRSLSFYLIRP